MIANSGARALIAEGQFLRGSERCYCSRMKPPISPTASPSWPKHPMTRLPTMKPWSRRRPPRNRMIRCLAGRCSTPPAPPVDPRASSPAPFAAGGPLEMMELVGGGLSQMLGIPSGRHHLLSADPSTTRPSGPFRSCRCSSAAAWSCGIDSTPPNRSDHRRPPGHQRAPGADPVSSLSEAGRR